MRAARTSEAARRELIGARTGGTDTRSEHCTTERATAVNQSLHADQTLEPRKTNTDHTRRAARRKDKTHPPGEPSTVNREFAVRKASSQFLTP
jgi:hypothetical protein